MKMDLENASRITANASSVISYCILLTPREILRAVTSKDS